PLLTTGRVCDRRAVADATRIRRVSVGGRAQTMNRLSRVALLFVLLLAACAPAQTSSGPQDQSPVAPPTVHKKVVAGLRGEPFTLSNELGRAGAGRVYGVAEVERMVHSGLSIEDDQVEQRALLAE